MSSYQCSGRRQVLCPREEHALWISTNPTTKAKNLKDSKHWRGQKSPSGRSRFSKSNIKQPDYSLQIHSGTNSFSSNMSCDLIKIKLKRMAITIISAFWRKKEEASNPKNAIPVVK
ncbi:hypothetical protein AMECASPLE_039193 [Ameca splendens]|uniref:Uncharacterized protein n=1 Tax=Ameca splendens TaxID=208324 RepID=A0ABV0YW02_9TELE